ncbi:hypothetical protein E0Z10_g2220 [Xylaria hypoxylon]|uniref:DUF410 domain-containing protein n=1 Tax=Xylaria hypoxylon TaxID=37992 RepID=A0A4Z0Z4N8_9PEZI|nr:hypothetical protein E0Z10_g2220 [Xylaria hypoxylon]
MSSARGGDKIEKIIARLQQRISEGQFYEAQQQTRGGSGGDLCVLLVDTYKQAELKPDPATKGKLLTCLRLFGSEEPTRKKYIGEIIAKSYGNVLTQKAVYRWSSRFGDYPAGDPELHHVAGSLYAEEHEAYDAEKHLLLGTKDSAEVLARMEYEWFKEDEAHTAAMYAGRAVLPYLITANVRAANTSYRVFTSALNDDKQSQLGAQDVSSNSADLRVFPSIPLLNFLGLLLLAIQRGNPDIYRQLTAKYSSHLKELEMWNEALEIISEIYFGIAKPRQSNPLMDMMSGFFGGGGGGGAPAGGSSRKPAIKAPTSTSMPAAEGLD